MENQHRKISGYRELTQEEIDLINEIKAVGLTLGTLVERVNAHIGDQYGNDMVGVEEYDRLEKARPFCWFVTGRDHLQQGLMALTRAVAQPDGF